jgi:hypothetical protein
MRRLFFSVVIFILLASIAQAGHRQYGIGFSVGAAFPTGTFEKDPNPGFGFKGFFGFGLGNNFELHTSFGWYSFSGDTDREEDDPENVLYQDGGNYMALPWAFGVRYYFIDSAFKPYVMLNGAINFNRYRTPKKLNQDNTVTGGESISLTEFGYNVGAGTLYKIGRHSDLEFAVLYNSVLDDQRGKFISLELGINWSF